MLGERLKYLRQNKDYTQQQIAESLKINRVTYTQYELDKREPDNTILSKLADFFNVTTDYLLGRTDDPQGHKSNNDHKIITIAAHRTDDPTSDLPPEAEERVQEFIELMRMKYGKKK